jgi:ubiquinone/menaquinone biosynthesis C-methylase UbiE
VNGRVYDFFTQFMERREIGARRRSLVAPLRGRVLEVGAGTGHTLAHYRNADAVVALEPDEGMASRIPAKAAAAPVPVEVVSAPAEELPFPDGSFDAAVAIFVLCSVRDPARALAEIHRVLRPGGELVVFEHVRGEGRTARWQDRCTPLQRRLAGNCHLNRDTRAALAAAGFDVSEVEPAPIPGSFPLVRQGIYGRAIKTSS